MNERDIIIRKVDSNRGLEGRVIHIQIIVLLQYTS